MKQTSSRSLRYAILVSLLGFALPAFAYLDPSTGSMILSAVIGMFATVGLAVKTYWYKLKGLFRGRPSPHSDLRTADPRTGHPKDGGAERRDDRGRQQPAD